ncbi:MAG: class I SAM-dependent methyltransferase [Nitrososphaerales archaeon]
MSQPSFGLKEEWRSVEDVLEQVIPVYDRTNRYISLGTDLRVRKEGLALLLQTMKVRGKENFSVLDLGSGSGKMSELLSDLSSSPNTPKPTFSTMLDALRPMMKLAKSRNSSSEGVLGVYENIPIRNESLDVAIAGFAIRDARNLNLALSEVARILVNKGLFLIVDLNKPESRSKQFLIGFYWKVLAPLIAFAATGRLGLKFAALSTTFRRLPTSKEFIDILERLGFTKVETRFSMLGGVCILLFERT